MRRNTPTGTGKISRVDSGYFAVIHVSPAKSGLLPPDSGNKAIEGNTKAVLNWTPGARALLLIALGSASWIACAMTANLVRRIIV